MTQCLQLIRQISPDAVQHIVDIGVQVKTEFLMEVFPDRHHHLFEPATTYHSQLEKNYSDKGIAYTLNKVAVSDTDGVLYLHTTSQDGSGRITHSQIRPDRDDKMPFLVAVEEIPTRKLDSIFADEPLADLSYIVKLDVDGVEEKIIAGGQTVLRGASFVIIETSIGRRDLCSRAALLEKLGFRIFDMCDNAYYYGQLALVDLVMINDRLRADEIKYRPWDYSGGKVHWANWQHGFRDLEAEPVQIFFP
jgi:FkbM family methyltransferase